MKIEEIRKSILESKYRISDHAVDEMSEDNLGLIDVLYLSLCINRIKKNGWMIRKQGELNEFKSNQVHSLWNWQYERKGNAKNNIYEF